MILHMDSYKMQSVCLLSFVYLCNVYYSLCTVYYCVFVYYALQCLRWGGGGCIGEGMGDGSDLQLPSLTREFPTDVFRYVWRD